MTGERLDLLECYHHNSCSLCIYIFLHIQTHIWTPVILNPFCETVTRDTLTVIMFWHPLQKPSEWPRRLASLDSFTGFSRSPEHAEIQPNPGALVGCKSAQQMRPEQPPGYILNFGFPMNQEYCHAGRRITCTNLFFNHFSGRHSSVFMATTGRS